MKTDPQWLTERLNELYNIEITMKDWRGEDYKISLSKEVIAAIINAEIIAAAQVYGDFLFTRYNSAQKLEPK